MFDATPTALCLLSHNLCRALEFPVVYICMCGRGSGIAACVSYCCGSSQTEAPSTSMSGQSAEERDETSCEYHLDKYVAGSLRVHVVFVCDVCMHSLVLTFAQQSVPPPSRPLTMI